MTLADTIPPYSVAKRQEASQDAIDALQELLAQTKGPEHDALVAYLADSQALSKRDATSELAGSTLPKWFKDLPHYCDFIACDDVTLPKSFKTVPARMH